MTRRLRTLHRRYAVMLVAMGTIAVLSWLAHPSSRTDPGPPAAPLPGHDAESRP